MMRKLKGIVCEKKAKYSVFLTEDGEFLRGIPINAAVQIGEEAEFHLFAQATAPKRMKPIFIAPALIAAMLLIILVASWFPKTTPAYAYIQVEGDSKIEIGVDEEGKVISLHPTEGGMEDWEGQSIDLVLAKAVEQVRTDENELAVTTVYEKENKPKLNKQIEKAVQQVQKAKPSSKKNSVEPKPKNPQTETKPPGQIKKEEKLPNPTPAQNKEQKNNQKSFENNKSENKTKGKTEKKAKNHEPIGKKEQQPQENKPSNNSNNIPGQEKQKNEEKSNNGNNQNNSNNTNNKPNKEKKNNNGNNN